MPVEIRELVIRTKINPPQDDESRLPPSETHDKEGSQIDHSKELMRQISGFNERKKER